MPALGQSWSLPFIATLRGGHSGVPIFVKTQKMAAAYPYPQFVNNTATAQRMAPGVYVKET